MKYIVGCTIAFIICFTLGWIITRLIKKKRLRNLSNVASFLMSTGIGLIIILVICCIYFANYYHVDSKDLKKVYANSNIVVKKIDGGYFIDGPSKTSALIFYPGAKVEALSYAPLLSKIAESGIDCFLADMPLNMAIFDMNIADKFIDKYSYTDWIAMGHSMGGIAISSYANKHSDKISCLVLLASYSSEKIEENIEFYSIYGSNDGCLDKSEYEKKRVNWPSDAKEIIIEGGNHAQFGNYGLQTLDGVSEISADKQQQMIVDLLLNRKNH